MGPPTRPVPRTRLSPGNAHYCQRAGHRHVELFFGGFIVSPMSFSGRRAPTVPNFLVIAFSRWQMCHVASTSCLGLCVMKNILADVFAGCKVHSVRTTWLLLCYWSRDVTCELLFDCLDV